MPLRGIRYGRNRIAFTEGVEERRSRNKKEISREGTTEIEQAVVVPRGPANEHVFQHLFGRARRSAVANEISAKLAVSRASKRHVVAQNLLFFPVLDDCGERVVRRSGIYRIIQLNIRSLLSTDDSLLRFRWQIVPGVHIVKVFLTMT